MRLTSPFSIIKNAISDLKRVPKDKKKKVKTEIKLNIVVALRGETGTIQFDTPLFSCYNKIKLENKCLKSKLLSLLFDKMVT